MLDIMTVQFDNSWGLLSVNARVMGMLITHILAIVLIITEHEI